MKKLSEYKDEEAIELLADIIEPISVIFSDDKVKTVYRETRNKLLTIKCVLKNHAKEVIDILAILENTPREEYHCNIASLPITLVEIMNDEELKDFFVSQSQTIMEEPSGSAMEVIQETEEE